MYLYFILKWNKTLHLGKIFCFLCIFTLYVSDAAWRSSGGPEGGNISSIIAIDSILIAGANPGGIYRSIDMGESWQFVGSGTRARFITNIDTLGSILIASAKAGGMQQYALSFSYDKGATWSENESIWPFMGIETFTVHENSIFVKVQQGVLFRSDDTAKTWISLEKNVPSGLFLNVNMFYSYGDTLLAATGGGVMYTANNGRSWVDISKGLPDTALSSIALNGNPIFSVAKKGQIIMAGMRSSLYMSLNNGANWKLLKSLPLDMFVTAIENIDSIWFFGFQGAGISIFDYSKDSWITQQLNIDLGYQSVWRFCLADDQIFISSESGIYKIMDSTQVHRKSEGIYASVVSDFSRKKGSLIVTTMGSGVFEKTSSSIWKHLNNNTLKNQLTKCVSSYEDFLTIGTIPKYLSEQGGVYFALYNPGNMFWQSAIAYSNQSCSTCISYIRDLESDKGTLFIGGSGGFFVSSDSGKSITKVAGSDMIIDVNCFYKNPFSDDLMIGSNQGVFRYNTTTNTLSGQLLGHLTYTISGNQMSLFAGAWRQGVLRSDNNGDTWIKTSLQLPTNVPVVALACIGDSIFAGTDGLGVYFSADNGDNWQELSDGLTCPLVKALHIHDGILYAGTNGGSVFEMSLTESNATINQSKHLNAPRISAIAKKNSIRIHIQNYHVKELSLTIFDISGRTIFSKFVQSNQDFTIALSLATKAYFIQIKGKSVDFKQRLLHMK